MCRKLGTGGILVDGAGLPLKQEWKLPRTSSADHAPDSLRGRLMRTWWYWPTVPRNPVWT